MNSKISCNKVFMRFVVLCLAAWPCLAQNRGPSTPEERARVVKFARDFEAKPLSKDLQSEREWAIRWLIEVPDISVSLCSEFPDSTSLNKYKHKGELVAVAMLSQAAFVIEHPDKSKDLEAQYRAGMEGVLKAYEGILKENPKAQSKYLDEMLGKRDRGELAAYVKESLPGCKSKQ